MLKHKLLSHIHPFLFPGDGGNSTTQLRSCYERTCAPFEKELTSTLEKLYREKRMYSPTSDWIFARVDVPSVHAQEGRSRLASASQSRPKELPVNERGSSASHPEATHAVLRARISTNALEKSEEDHYLFEDFKEYHVRLDLRNHIIRMWYRNVKQRLAVSDALKDVPYRFHEIGVRVYTFLNAVALINYGAIPLTSSDALHFPMQTGRSKKRIAVLGAGISGLTAARQLLSFGFDVTVFEARDRPGGRIFTDSEKFSAPVDLGAMVLTGLLQNPVAILAEQTNSEVHTVRTSCPLFDIDGKWVPSVEDRWAELEYNAVLSATARYREKETSKESAKSMSLGEAFQRSLSKRMSRRRMLVARNEQVVKALPENHKHVKSLETHSSLPATPEIEAVSRKRPRAPHAREKEPVCITQYKENCETDSKIKRKKLVPTETLEFTDRCRAMEPNLDRTRVFDREGGTSPSAAVKSVQKGLRTDRNENIERFESFEDVSKVGRIGRLMRWHIANLEYGCAATIDSVSLSHWDQDDPYGFEGDHGLLKTGFGVLVDALMEDLHENVKFEREIVSVRWNKSWDKAVLDIVNKSAKSRKSQEQFDAVLSTIPLGVLKDGSIKFHPSLPKSKRDAINRLGSGGLMKVALEFPHKFWGDTDMFGALRETAEKRGSFYVFWSLFGTIGRPVLLAFVIEPLVESMENHPDGIVVEEAMNVLKRAFPDAPEPVATSVTKWGSDPYSRGAYSYIPVGSSGDDYDLLADPVEPTLFFAGEHTCRRHPTTCASGMISGLREATRIAEKFGAVRHMARLDAKFLDGCIHQSGISPSCTGRRSCSVRRSPSQQGPGVLSKAA